MPRLTTLVLASLCAWPAGVRGQDVDTCSASCALGMHCDRNGHCVADPEAAARVHRGSDLTEPAGDGAYEHDGFMLRVTVGPAGAWIAERADVAVLDAGAVRTEQAALDVSGAAFALGIDAGFSISPSFAWHVRLAQFVLPSPALDGVDPQGRGDSARTLALLGPGLTYFGRIGLYAAAAAGVAFTRRRTYDGEGGLGDAGVGLNLDFGWEGWIAEQLALGGAVRGWWSLTTGSSRDGDRSQRALGLALALSLTYH
jgi:hypothetical protein